MFYYPTVLKRHTGCFSTIWLVATKGIRVPRRDFLKVNVTTTCDDIMSYVLQQVPPPLPGLPRPRFSLYLSSQLQYGVILVYHRQCAIFLEDVQSILGQLVKKISTQKIDLEEHGRQALLSDALSLLEETEGATDPLFGTMLSAAALASPGTLIRMGQRYWREGSPEWAEEGGPSTRGGRGRRKPERDEGSPEGPAVTRPKPARGAVITASPESITLREVPQAAIRPPEFEGEELADLPDTLDLLLAQADDFPEGEEVAPAETERRRREGDLEMEREPVLPGSPLGLQQPALPREGTVPLALEQLVQPAEPLIRVPVPAPEPVPIPGPVPGHVPIAIRFPIPVPEVVPLAVPFPVPVLEPFPIAVPFPVPFLEPVPVAVPVPECAPIPVPVPENAPIPVPVPEHAPIPVPVHEAAPVPVPAPPQPAVPPAVRGQRRRPQIGVTREGAPEEADATRPAAPAAAAPARGESVSARGDRQPAIPARKFDSSPDSLDLLLAQTDDFPEGDEVAPAERERRTGDPRRERSEELTTSTLDLQPTAQSSEDAILSAREEPVPPATSPSDHLPPGHASPLPSSPQPAERERPRKRPQPEQQAASPSEVARKRAKKRQLIFADPETQLRQEELERHMNDPRFETRPRPPLPSDIHARLPPAQLFGEPCTPLLGDVLALWRNAAVIVPLQGPELLFGERGSESTSSEKNGEAEKEVPRGLEEPEILEMSGPAPLQLEESRQASPMYPSEGSVVSRSISTLQDIPEAMDEAAGLMPELAEQEEEVFHFHELLPPDADRRIVSNIFQRLLDKLSLRKFHAQQDEPYGDILIRTGPEYESEEEAMTS